MSDIQADRGERAVAGRYEPERPEPTCCDACGEFFEVGWGAARVLVDPENPPLDAWYFCSERCEREFVADMPAGGPE